MIVPGNRLLFWVGASLPALAVAPSLPGAQPLALGLAVLLVFLALLDVGLSIGRLDGIVIHPSELVRLSKDRDGRIDLRIGDESQMIRNLTIGLSFPEEIPSPHYEMTVELPADVPFSTFPWPIRAIKRGRYFLDQCYLETPSRFGFWSIRRTVPVQTEIRVYPNLYSERKNLAALFMNRISLGIHAQRQIGKGRDFEQLREYLPGDCYEDIHWKATAKRNRPVTKVFQIERTQEIYVVIDASRLSGRPAGRADEDPEGIHAALILERFITSALIMGLAAQRQGDLFGVMAFSDRVQSFVRAKNGQAHFNACREALFTIQSQSVSPDFTEAFTFIATRLRRRALLLFLTSLDDPLLAESFTRNIHMISRRHLVLVNMINPPGVRPVFSSPDIESIGDLYHELGGHFLWTGLKETEKVLRQRNVGFSLLENEKMCVELVSQYMGVKLRQAL